MKTSTLVIPFSSKQNSIFLIQGLICFVLLNIVADYLFSHLRTSSFYLSESFLFSTYWLIFAASLPFINWFLEISQNLFVKRSVIMLVAILHFLTYPALVWLFSKAFYDYTFEYQQTFEYALTTYLLVTILAYGFYMWSLKHFKNENLSDLSAIESTKREISKVTSLTLTDTSNVQSHVIVDDIITITANAPYVIIQLENKKFVHHATLKSMEQMLDDQKFIRIHKSCIVNLSKVSSIKSRGNGDYDLEILGGSIVRLARTYVKSFKSKWYKR